MIMDIHMSSPVEQKVQLDRNQRSLIWRQNHGWVKTKRCSFCKSMCHLDDMGIWNLGRAYNDQHWWFCSMTCAKGISYPGVQRLLSTRAS